MNSPGKPVIEPTKASKGTADENPAASRSTAHLLSKLLVDGFQLEYNRVSGAFSVVAGHVTGAPADPDASD